MSGCRRLIVMPAALSWLLAACTADAAPPPTPAPHAAADWASVTRDAGKLVATHGNSGSYVVVFEERHDSATTQVQVAMMLNRLYHRHNLRDMALEGAVVEEPVPDARWFRALPDERTRLGVALELLRSAEVNAGEFAAMVFGDFRLHAVERQSEYAVRLPGEADTVVSAYLSAIAFATMSAQQRETVNRMAREGRRAEALAYTMGADPWVRQRYERWNRGEPTQSIEETRTLLEDLEERARRTSAAVADDAERFAETKKFFDTAGVRSKTMTVLAANALKEVRGGSALAMSIGAAHTESMLSFLDQGGTPYAAVSPLALSNHEPGGALEPQAHHRKGQGFSVDADGGVGAMLDGRRKPAPVLNEAWLRAKARVMYAGTVIAKAAAAPGSVAQPPFGLTPKALGLDDPGEPGAVGIDLRAMRALAVTADGKRRNEVIFPVSLPHLNKTLWAKAVAVDPAVGPDLSEQSLEAELKQLLGRPMNAAPGVRIALGPTADAVRTLNLGVDP